ncbi:unnamed protein product, partial [Candidula unifasciata]
MSGSNDGSAGTINSLLKYRFTKKPAVKGGHSESPDDDQPNGLIKENSANSNDSQATVLYSSQKCSETSQHSVDSQATVISSQNTVSPSFSQNAKAPADKNNTSQRPVTSSPSSPVFKSHTSQKQDTVITGNSTSPPGGRGKPQNANGASNCSTAGFNPVHKSQNDSSSRATDDQVNQEDFQRLREMFPGSSENRIRAALIVYPRDFQKAVQFMTSEQSKQGEKRPAPISDSDDDMPQVTAVYKRIKTIPESPSPTRVVSVDFLSESRSSKTKTADSNSDAFQKGLDFLRGCFPAKSVEDLKAALAANDGDTQMAVASLSEEGSSDSKLAESLSKKTAGPSSDTKPGKSNSALKPQVAASK